MPNPEPPSKWRSNDSSPAPISIAWAPIHMSLVGIGAPLFLSSAAILENRSAVVRPTGRKWTKLLARYRSSTEAFASKREPRRNPKKSSSTTIAETKTASERRRELATPGDHEASQLQRGSREI